MATTADLLARLDALTGIVEQLANRPAPAPRKAKTTKPVAIVGVDDETRYPADLIVPRNGKDGTQAVTTDGTRNVWLVTIAEGDKRAAATLYVSKGRRPTGLILLTEAADEDGAPDA